jgi:hypothetical protein
MQRPVAKTEGSHQKLMTFAAGSARALVAGLGSPGEKDLFGAFAATGSKVKLRSRRVQTDIPAPPFGVPTEPASASPTGGGVQQTQFAG